MSTSTAFTSCILLVRISSPPDQGTNHSNTQIWSHPELALNEHHAHSTFVTALTKLDFPVTPHAYGLPTSFATTVGHGGRLLIFNAEYDALPAIGHACGHNLIATASLAAFLGVAAALRRSGKPGRVRLLGTPAEEGQGGKIMLINAGAYKGVDACLMLHPGSANGLPEGVLADAYTTTLAVVMFKVTYHGRPAHAGLAPWEGVNALDAAVLGYGNVSALRQQIMSDERVHGIIRHGGDAPNVIPAKTVLEYCVRAPTLVRMQALKERVIACFEAAATATGCGIEVDEEEPYANTRENKVISKAYSVAMEKLGEGVTCDFTKGPVFASTDQGNVSYECPAWQGGFGIVTPAGVQNHTGGFTESAGTKDAFKRCLTAAKGMAATGLKVLLDEKFASDIRIEFEGNE